MALWSLGNLVAAPGVVITCPTAEDVNYPAPNLGTANRPDLPAKTTAMGDLRYVVNYGSAKSVIGWAALYTNVTTVHLQANATDSWGTPTYDSPAQTVLVNPGNGRYCHVFFPPVAQLFQFNSLYIPDQTPADGSGVYRIGALWAIELGDLITLRGIRYDDELEPVSPADYLTTKSQRSQRILRGPEFMRLTGEHFAEVGPTPFLNDDAAAWIAFERAWWERDFALYIRRQDHPAWIGVMRQVERPKWKLGPMLATAPFTWEEVTGP